MQIELTDDERDVLYAILYSTVGGDPRGPRKHADSLYLKISEKSDWNKYRAKIGEVSTFGTLAVVVSENDGSQN